MASPVDTMSAIRNGEDNNAESRMDTSISPQKSAIDLTKKIIPDSQETLDSQETVEDNNGTAASTPPTSDELSSQSQESQLATAQEPLHLVTTAHTAGQKRTASGMIKSSSVVNKSPTSPVVRPGHSRNTSISNGTSNSNRISELTAELRTRLSYAMVKVNNGWQSLPIDEVESLASQVASPTSSTSTIQGRRNRITSPRVTIASLQGENASSRPFSSSAPVLGASNSLASLTTDQPATRTYESFWREHSANTNPNHRNSPFHPHPSLAPPVDIISSHSSKSQLQHPRRTAQHGGSSRPPPVLPTHTVSDLSQSSTTSPHTPTRDPAIDSMLRTPSQKSIQEQDAIESLLFMSSPGNSTKLLHTFPPPISQSNQQSPLRSEFLVSSTPASSISQPQQHQHQHQHHRSKSHNHHLNLSSRRNRKVGFEDEDSSEGAYSISRGSSAGDSSAGRRRRGAGDDVDKMLDGMRDASSDEDEIELVTTPRRRTVDRVG